jgi:hypothetical protein
VRVEGVPVVRVFWREGGHPDGFRVTHLLEQGIQIPVLYRAQRDNGYVFLLPFTGPARSLTALPSASVPGTSTLPAA